MKHSAIHSAFSDEMLDDCVLPETNVLEEMGIFDCENLDELTHDVAGHHEYESWDSQR